MSLSNRVKFYLVIVLIVPFLQNCGWRQSGENNTGQIISESKGDIPFTTKEPDVFQGEFFRTSSKDSERFFFARKGENWRYDIFEGDTKAYTFLNAGRQIYISHLSGVYADEPIGQYPANVPDFQYDLTLGLLNKRKFVIFENLGSDGGIVRYRATIDESEASEVLIDIDEKSGMMVKQEFLSRNEKDAAAPFMKFEIKGLNLEVNEDVFDIPKGYRKVTWEEFNRLRQRELK